MADVLMQVASEIGRSPSQVAINWVRQQAPNIIPILGARRVSQFLDNLGVLEFTLDDEQLMHLDPAIEWDFFLGFVARTFDLRQEIRAPKPVRAAIDRAAAVENHDDIGTAEIVLPTHAAIADIAYHMDGSFLFGALFDIRGTRNHGEAAKTRIRPFMESIFGIAAIWALGPMSLTLRKHLLATFPNHFGWRLHESLQ